jgi:cytoskeletal protein CcmA (bactofilin family)
VSVETNNSIANLVPRNGRMTALLRKISAATTTDETLDGGISNAATPLSSISTDFTIAGNIICKGRAQFDGELNGDIECNHLIVGSNGRVIGDIKAENVVIYGTVQGAIHCTKIVLKSGANVTGDIYHNGIAIEMGATFSGRSDRIAASGDNDAGPMTNAQNLLPQQPRQTAQTGQ